MAVRDDVLRNLALVFLHLFGKEIDREALLEHSVAAVLFIRQYALDGFILPPCFFSSESERRLLSVSSQWR